MAEKPHFFPQLFSTRGSGECQATNIPKIVKGYHSNSVLTNMNHGEACTKEFMGRSRDI
jgi:hypothetical protein